MLPFRLKRTRCSGDSAWYLSVLNVHQQWFLQAHGLLRQMQVQRMPLDCFNMMRLSLRSALNNGGKLQKTKDIRNSPTQSSWMHLNNGQPFSSTGLVKWRSGWNRKKSKTSTRMWQSLILKVWWRAFWKSIRWQGRKDFVTLCSTLSSRCTRTTT